MLPHPEYPRPTLVREKWLNLNGAWQLHIPRGEQDVKSVREWIASDIVPRLPSSLFDHIVQVPFPLESSLSQVQQSPLVACYRRTFSIPSEWENDSRRVLINFGAVDNETTLYINGVRIGEHCGGYNSFSFEITSALKSGENTLDVVVLDATEKEEIAPRGRQSRSGGETFYTPTSGIWQTVWIEAVSSSFIKKVSSAGKLAEKNAAFEIEVDKPLPGLSLAIEVFDGAQSLAKQFGGSENKIVIDLSAQPEQNHTLQSWSPQNPKLYGVIVTLLDGTTVVDQVTSYFAFRDWKIIVDDAQRSRLTLGGQPFFWRGVIDQGMWRDGLYTPPSDEAMRRDILLAKELGFNLIRKYDKIESERWYYWCDRLGICVWQDMPSGDNQTAAAQEEFARELQAMIAAKKVHPSICVWSIFSEGKGQFKTTAMTEMVRQLDPTRFICSASGWNDTGTGDISSSHRMPYPLTPSRTSGRISVVGLYGGITLGIAKHSPPNSVIGFYTVTDAAALEEQYAMMQISIQRMQQEFGIDGAIFHQLTDVEAECNGLQTYDRAILKIKKTAGK